MSLVAHQNIDASTILYLQVVRRQKANRDTCIYRTGSRYIR